MGKRGIFNIYIMVLCYRICNILCFHTQFVIQRFWCQCCASGGYKGYGAGPAALPTGHRPGPKPSSEYKAHQNTKHYTNSVTVNILLMSVSLWEQIIISHNNSENIWWIRTQFYTSLFYIVLFFVCFFK